MAFNVAFNAKFTKPLIRQLIAVVQRDIQDALDTISGTAGSYKPFVQYELSASNPMVQPPLLVVAPRSVNINNDSYQQALDQEVTIQAEVLLSNQDPNVLVEQIQDYVGALTLIFDNLGASVGQGNPECDFYNALSISLRGMIDPSSGSAITTTTPMTFGSVTHCYVTELGFADMQRSHEGYFMSGGLILSVGMVES